MQTSRNAKISIKDSTLRVETKIRHSKQFFETITGKTKTTRSFSHLVVKIYLLYKKIYNLEDKTKKLVDCTYSFGKLSSSEQLAELASRPMKQQLDASGSQS